MIFLKCFSVHSFIQIRKGAGICLFLMAIATNCWPQTVFETIPVNQLNFGTIQEADGLSNNLVTSIIKDHYGFMWFATSDGLNRYDGASFKIFRHIDRDSTSVCSNKTGNLCEDADGNIWGIGTQVFRYNRKSATFTNFSVNQNGPASIPAVLITGITKDKNGDLWMSCDDNKYFLIKYDHQIKRFEPFKIKDFPVLPSQRDCRSPSMILGDDGMIYMSVTNGIIQFDPLHTRCNYIKSGGCSTSLLFDHSNAVWADMWGRGIMLVDFKDHSVKQYVKNNPDGPGDILSIKRRSNQELWIGTVGDGLFIFNTRSNIFYPVQHQDRIFGFPNEESIYNIYQENDGATWFGTQTGILEISPHNNQFQTIGPLPRPNEGKRIWKVKVAKAVINPGGDKIYLGARHGIGISAFDMNTQTLSLVYPLPLINDEALFEDLIIDRKGRIWFTDDDALYKMTESDGKYIVKKRTLSTPADSFDLSRLLEDNDGNIWIGTRNNGCYKLDVTKDSVTHFPLNKSKKGAYAFELCDPAATSANGDIWFHDPNHFSCLHRSSLSFEHFNRPYPTYSTSPASFISTSDYFIGLVVDSNDHVWICDHGHGILEFDPLVKRYHLYSSNQGLPNPDINGMAFDSKHQTIWINTYSGISSFDIKTHRFAAYRMTEGLYPGEGVSRLDFSAGKLLVSFRDGHFSYATAENLNPNLEIPPIVFTQLTINGKEWQGAGDINNLSKINLNYYQNYISFSFAALNYTQPKNNQYACRLDPVDKNWVPRQTRNYAIYSNLEPGTYVFHVKGCNNNGMWNQTGRSITIVIAPAWWQTWFFRTALILALLTLVFFSTRYYFKQELKLQQEQFEKQKAVENIRSKLSRDIHDEIGSGLTKISLMSQCLKLNFDTNKAVDPNLVQKITDTSKEIIGNLGEVVWAINPQHDNLASLLAYIRNYIAHLFEETAVQYLIDFPEKIPAITIHPELKRNLFLVIKESLNNILKHAAATEVIIHFQFTRGKYCFNIIDNGKGIIDLKGRDFGNGLMNMKNRMQAVNGLFNITSETGKGTAIALEGALEQ
jgi:signal transduction histidine kinase/ligand-binding sensor domain-containing protein